MGNVLFVKEAKGDLPGLLDGVRRSSLDGCHPDKADASG